MCFIMLQGIQENRNLNQVKETRKREKHQEKNGINTYRFNPVIFKPHLPFISLLTLSKSKSITEEAIC